RLVEALAEQGWEQDHAKNFVEAHADRFAIDDEIDALESEYVRMRSLFQKVEIAPLFVSLSSSRLHLPSWFEKYK
ncbi:MAG TPA: hypothetical protein PLF23_20765, partial [Candidatus Obscuribacter sp.]|nr:hypothetical protein [Candidatus Obscuribacter sp.]